MSQKPIKKERKRASKRSHLVVPLIVISMIICVIAVIAIGIFLTKNNENAQIAEIEPEEEKISAATDIAATSIGTNAKATFTASTGEIHIYNSKTSSTATISISSWSSFVKKILDAGTLNAVTTITFDNEVYAPEDPRNLFKPVISGAGYTFYELTTINNANYLNTSKVTTMDSMFYFCGKLTSIDISGWDVSKVTTMENMFWECTSLTTVGDLSSWTPSVLTTTEAMFKGCSSLVNFNMSGWRITDECDMYQMFDECSSLRSFTGSSIPIKGIKDSMFRRMFFFGEFKIECVY